MTRIHQGILKIRNKMILLKNIFLKLFLLSVIPMSSFGQFTLTIEIDGLRNNTGQILVELCNEKEIKVVGVKQTIIDKHCTIVIENLKAGKYAFRYFHDENKNENIFFHSRSDAIKKPYFTF